MEIVEVHQVSSELVEAFARLMPQLNPNWPAPTEAELEEIVTSPGNSLFIARENGSQGRITGTLTLVVFRTPTGVHAWIEDVVVDEAARGQGIGEMLTWAGIQRAAEQGAKAVDLTSRPSREAANRLYQRMGFQLRSTNIYRYSLR